MSVAPPSSGPTGPIPYTPAEVEAELSRCITRLLVHEPFFGHLLGAVDRVLTFDCPTMGVGAVGDVVKLLVNPRFFMEGLTSREQRIAVIKHEALHLVFKHIHRPPPTRAHALVWNVACDLVVNQYVGAPWDLPASAITLDTFPELELEPDLTVEHYFERLLDPGGDDGGAAARAHIEAVAQAERHSDHSRWDEGARESPQASAASSAAASPAAASPAVASASPVAQALALVCARVGDAGLGDLPGGLRALVGATAGRALDWKRILRLFAAGGDRTRIASTTRRESRRFATIPGIKVQRLRDLVVAIDTSGSVSEATLARIFAEVRRLWRAGADVEVVECDQAVRRTWAYRGRAPRGIAGGGGTDFDPVFTWLRKRRTRPDGCVYITDGFGPRPRVHPRCRLLWLVTAGGATGALRFGQVARVPFG